MAFWYIAFAFIVIVIIFRILSSSNIKLPPGPRGYPLVGNSPQLGRQPARKIAEWSRKYGRTVGLWIGSRPMVVIHDPELARTVFNDDNTTGRDHNLVVNQIYKGRGLLQIEGNLWKEHRRFATATLRELGMGKDWMEKAILVEVCEVIDVFKAHVGQRYDPNPLLTTCVSNIVAAMVFGKRFDHHDEGFIKLSNLFAENQKLVKGLFFIQEFPILKYIPGLRFRRMLQQLQCQVTAVLSFCQDFIDEHQQKLADSRMSPSGIENKESVRVKDDYIMAYLKEREKPEHVNNPNSTFTDDQLLFSIHNLFAAGSLTTAATLMWAMNLFGLFPEVQEKVHAEMDAKIGRNRPITMADRGVLTYTEAALNDIQRLASAGPLSLARTNYEPMTIDGYPLPARTTLFANAYAMHHDPKLWKKPDELYPEHFLDQNGEVQSHSKIFFPFGVGKRACPAESLARMELFLFFTNIMQNFKVRGNPQELKDAQENIAVGSPFAAGPFKVEMTYRGSS